MDRDIFPLLQGIGQHPTRAEFITAVNNVHPLAEVGKIKRILDCCVAAPHNKGMFPLIESTVTGRAVGYPPPRKLLLTRNPQLAAFCTVRDDHCTRTKSPARLGFNRLFRLIKPNSGYPVKLDSRTLLNRLVIQAGAQLHPADPAVSGIIFDLGGICHLPAADIRLEHNGSPARPLQVDRRCQTCRPCADNDCIILFHCLFPPAIIEVVEKNLSDPF